MCFRILLLLLSLGVGVRAQSVPTSSPTVFWQLTAGAVVPPTSLTNEVLLQQVGAGNQAVGVIESNWLNAASPANAATLRDGLIETDRINPHVKQTNLLMQSAANS